MASEEDKAGKKYDEAFADMASLRVTRATLSDMKDGELALWQVAQKPSSAEFILADHEWRSRQLAQQNRAIYGAAIVGVFGVVVGVVLGWYLASGGLLAQHHP